jgi:hypothetical protein
VKYGGSEHASTIPNHGGQKKIEDFRSFQRLLAWEMLCKYGTEA